MWQNHTCVFLEQLTLKYGEVVKFRYKHIFVDFMIQLDHNYNCQRNKTKHTNNEHMHKTFKCMNLSAKRVFFLQEIIYFTESQSIIYRQALSSVRFSWDQEKDKTMLNRDHFGQQACQSSDVHDAEKFCGPISVLPLLKTYFYVMTAHLSNSLVHQ